MSRNGQDTRLEVSLLASEDAVLPFTSDWNRLAGDVPFRRWEWHGSWWRYFGRTDGGIGKSAESRRLFVLLVTDHGQTVAIAPWYTERTTAIGNVIRFLGDGKACSDYQAILTQPGYELEVSETLAQWLGQQQTKSHAADTADDTRGWDLIELTGVDAHHRVVPALVRNLQQLGFTTHERTNQNCWRLAIPPSWEAYLGSLSKPNRRRMRLSDKRSQASDCRIRLASTLAEFTDIWEIFVDLHQRRRQSLGDAGCFASGPFSQFLHQAAYQFFQANLLDLFCVSIGGRPVAAELCFCGEQTTFVYQTGIEPDAIDENPGWLANTASIQKAMKRGHAYFDLCRGDEDYKRRLGARPKPSLEIRIVPPNIRAQFRHTAWITGTAVKELIKTGLTLTGIR